MTYLTRARSELLFETGTEILRRGKSHHLRDFCYVILLRSYELFAPVEPYNLDEIIRTLACQ